MIRKTLVLILSLSMLGIGGVSLTGCPEEKKETPPPKPTVQLPTGRDAVIGTWVAGRQTLRINADNSFSWQMARSCAAPPCPMTTMGGTWALSGNTIVMTTNGKQMNVNFVHSGPPRKLDVHNTMFNTKAVYSLSQ